MCDSFHNDRTQTVAVRMDRKCADRREETYKQRQCEQVDFSSNVKARLCSKLVS